MSPSNAPLAVEIIPVTPFQQNCSLLICTATRKAALIDAGGDIERLLAVAEKHAVVIEKLLVTHGHLDHCSAVADLRDRLQVPVEGPHHDDAFWIDQIPQRCQEYGFPPARCFTPERWLAHGDEVTVGDLLTQRRPLSRSHTRARRLRARAHRNRLRWRRAVQGLDRPHRLPARKSRRSD
jgi:glyoxylase-like metal-dependent hydrolase (beta-lactamase superfamily II)